MKKLKLSIITFGLLLSIGLFVSGCATILKGSTENLFISTMPAGAKVTINGTNSGLTPLAKELPTNRTYNITLEKEGYKKAQLTVYSKIEGGWVVIDVICGVLPLAVDAITENWYSLETNEIDVELEEIEN